MPGLHPSLLSTIKIPFSYQNPSLVLGRLSA